MKKLLAVAVFALTCLNLLADEVFIGYYIDTKTQFDRSLAPTTGETFSYNKTMIKESSTATPIYLQTQCYSPAYGVPESCSSNANYWDTAIQNYNYTLWDGWYSTVFTATTQIKFWNSTPVQQTAWVVLTYKEVNPATGGVGPLKTQQGWFTVPMFSTKYYGLPNAHIKFGQISVQWVGQ